MNDLPTGKDYVDVDMGHEFDGIREFDNRLPNWWLATLWGAILFAFGYWAYYHTIEKGLSIEATYQAEWAAHQKADELRAKNNQVTGSMLLELSAREIPTAAGKAIYDVNCVACHLPNGGGSVGPNLTDSAWIHGGEPMDIYKTIAEGAIAKGMPAWKSVLGGRKVGQVVAYLLTIKNTNVAGGKAAQGAEVNVPAKDPGWQKDPKVAAAIPTEDALKALATDAAKVEEGKVLFTTNCVACHRADGGGGIGPNLTDDAWLVGPSASDIYASISNGFVAKGMPGWKEILGDEKVQKITAFVLSIQNTNVKDGKAPQAKAP